MTREKLIEVMAQAMLEDELSVDPHSDFATVWANESDIWLSNARAALAALAAIEAAGVRLVPVEVEKVAIDVGASLAAAISLLERGGERAAPSRKMFNVMLTDYKKSLARARAYFNSPATLTKDTP